MNASWYCESCKHRFLGLPDSEGNAPVCNLCQSRENVKPCKHSSKPCKKVQVEFAGDGQPAENGHRAPQTFTARFRCRACKGLRLGWRTIPLRPCHCGANDWEQMNG